MSNNFKILDFIDTIFLFIVFFILSQGSSWYALLLIPYGLWCGYRGMQIQKELNEIFKED